jgi:O-antigen ligase
MIVSKLKNKLDKILSVLVLISPVFFLTVKHWINLIVLLLFVGSLYLLVKNKEISYKRLFSGKRLICICVIFSTPLLAIITSQFIRMDIYYPNWDSPLRFALCIPVFLYISNGGLKITKNKSTCQIWLTLIIPITLIWTFFFRINWPTSWGQGITTYFVDPLSFGIYTLLFSLIILLGLSQYWDKLSLSTRGLCFFGFLSGIFLSIGSGSRTGWFNLPFFIVIWSLLILRPKFGIKNTLLIVVALLLLVTCLLLSNDYLLNKIGLALKEITEYKLNKINSDTSVSLRLSFYRIGIMFFAERPLTGWGDLGWATEVNKVKVMKYASEFAFESLKHGFHNEVLTSAVRSGIWGFLASISLFGVVFALAIQGVLRKSEGEHRLVSITLLVFICHLAVSSMTTEITNLVFLSSFIGISLAVLLGEQFYLEESLVGI